MALTASQQQFVNSVWPFAVNASRKTGVDPGVIVAQSALETGWGRSTPNNNYFGIKGKGGTFQTQEFVNGKMVTVDQNFAGYQTPQDSFDAWANLMSKSSRYKNVIGAQDPNQQIAALGKSGYATDPNYGDKLAMIFGKIGGDATSLGSGTFGFLDDALSPIPGANVSDLFSAGLEAFGLTNKSGQTNEDGSEKKGWIQAILDFFSKDTLIRAVAIIIGLTLLAAAVATFVGGNKIATIAKEVL